MKATNRLACILVVILTATDGWAMGEDPFLVKTSPPVPGRQITPYLRYQIERAWDQDESRQACLRSVKTADDLQRLQKEIRGSLLAMIGGLPQVVTRQGLRRVGLQPRPGFVFEAPLMPREGAPAHEEVGPPG